MPDLEDSIPTLQPAGPPPWVVRPYQPGDTEGLLRLYGQVFGRERSEEELRWKLLRPGYPFDTLWVADAGGRIVGQHAGIPMRLKLSDRVVTVVHAVEAMTHDDFRREGMLTRLGGGLYDHWRESGVPLIIGLPHEGWGTRAYALGYRPAFPMRWLSRPLRPFAILLSRLGLRNTSAIAELRASRSDSWKQHPGGVLVRRAGSATEQFDNLWKHVGLYYRYAVVRDAEWVRWRYFAPPDGPYTVLLAMRQGMPTGYIAFRTVRIGGRAIGRIADLFARPADVYTVRALLREATRNLRASGADSAVILVAAGSPLYSIVRRHGFLINRGEYKASFIRLSEEIDADALNDPRNWLLTGGDFDVV
jgi:hypothetical protein